MGASDSGFLARDSYQVKRMIRVTQGVGYTQYRIPSHTAGIQPLGTTSAGSVEGRTKPR